MPELESIEGVASVSATGLLEESVNVIIRQDKVDAVNRKIFAAIDDKMKDAEEELADRRLVELEAPISGVPAPALCAWRKGRWVTPAMELFLELLREALAEGEPLTAAASAPAPGPAAGRACRLK